MIKPFVSLSAVVLCCTILSACAEPPPEVSPEMSTEMPAKISTKTSAETPGVLAEALGRIIPDERPDDIRPAPIAGFHEVSYGAQIFYISDDARYVLQGELLDLSTRENVTETRRATLRVGLLQTLDVRDTIVFAPKGETKYVIHVFTDVDCTYCRRLHAEIDEYNARGIEVRYLAFPRSGADTPLYDKMVSVWCAEDRPAALTRAKNGQAVKATQCDNPVRAQLALAADFGVSGTPTLVFPDGSSLPGYVPAAQLVTYLDAQAAVP